MRQRQRVHLQPRSTDTQVSAQLPHTLTRDTLSRALTYARLESEATSTEEHMLLLQELVLLAHDAQHERHVVGGRLALVLEAAERLFVHVPLRLTLQHLLLCTRTHIRASRQMIGLDLDLGFAACWID